MGGEWSENFDDNCRKIQGWYDKKEKPDGSFFFSDNNPPKAEGTTGAGVSNEKEDAILSNIASLAEFIPGIGTAVSKGLTIVGMFVKPAESTEQSADVREMIKAVNQVEANLKSYMNDETYIGESSFLTNVGSIIERYRTNEVFEMVSPDQYNTIKDALETVKGWTSSGSSNNSFLSVLGSVRSHYSYGDTKRLVLLLGLLNMYGECMLLRCVLQANLSQVFEKDSKAAEARQCRSDFAQSLREMKGFIEQQIGYIKPWVLTKKNDRLGGLLDISTTKADEKGNYWNLSGLQPYQILQTTVGMYYKNERQKIGGNAWNSTTMNPGSGATFQATGTETNHVWAFDDVIADRHFKATAREFNTSGRNYQPECDSVRGAMTAWKTYYWEKLQENVKEQFQAVDEAMNTWSVLCTKLGEFVKTLDTTNKTPINGAEFYKRMSATVSKK